MTDNLAMRFYEEWGRKNIEFMGGNVEILHGAPAEKVTMASFNINDRVRFKDGIKDEFIFMGVIREAGTSRDGKVLIVKDDPTRIPLSVDPNMLVKVE